MTPDMRTFIEASNTRWGERAHLNRTQIKETADDLKIPLPYWLLTSEHRDMTVRGVWIVPSLDDSNPEQDAVEAARRVELDALASAFRTPQANAPTVDPTVSYVAVDDDSEYMPDMHFGYVPFGHFMTLQKIIESGRFFPVYVTGDTGEGKTLMVEQICALAKRECILVSIAIETDQTDLLGGPTLVNGNVVNREGPVLIAMRRGAVLVLDEVDRGSNKLICLHSILEGKPYLNKQTGELVYPAPGFTVVATANTKGRGDDNGKYLSQLMDHAFMERFKVTIEQDQPPVTIQTSILNNVLDRYGVSDTDFSTKLVRWAERIHRAYQDGSCDEKISTRRLVHICETFSIFGDRLEAIRLCVNRFEPVVKKTFLDYYTFTDVNL